MEGRGLETEKKEMEGRIKKAVREVESERNRKGRRRRGW